MTTLYAVRGGGNIYVLENITLIGILIIAIWYDISTGRIPNRLNLAGCIAGLGLSIINYGIIGGRDSLFGMVLPVLLLFILFAFRIVGAGDIKLLSAIGAFISMNIIEVILLSLVLSAGWGVISLVSRFLRRKKITITTFPMSVTITIATLIVMPWGGELNGISGWLYR